MSNPIIGGNHSNFEVVVQYLDLDDLRALAIVSVAHLKALRNATFQHLTFYILEAPFIHTDSRIIFTNANLRDLDDRSSRDEYVVKNDIPEQTPHSPTWISMSEHELCDSTICDDIRNWIRDNTRTTVIKRINLRLPNYARRLLTQTKSAEIVIYKRLLGETMAPELKRCGKLLKYGNERSAFHKFACSWDHRKLEDSLEWKKHIFQDYSLYYPRRINVFICDECLDMPPDPDMKNGHEEITEERCPACSDQSLISAAQYEKQKRGLIDSYTYGVSLPTARSLPPYLHAIHEMVHKRKSSIPNTQADVEHRYVRYPRRQKVDFTANDALFTRAQRLESMARSIKRQPQLTNLPTNARRLDNLTITVASYDDFGCKEWKNAMAGVKCVPMSYNYLQVPQTILPQVPHCDYGDGGDDDNGDDDGDFYPFIRREPRPTQRHQHVVPNTDGRFYFCTRQRTQKYYMDVYNTAGVHTQLATSFPSLDTLTLAHRGHSANRTAQKISTDDHFGDHYVNHLSEFEDYFISVSRALLTKLRHLILKDAPIDDRGIATFIKRHPSINELTFDDTHHPDGEFPKHHKSLWSYLSHTERDGSNADGDGYEYDGIVDGEGRIIYTPAYNAVDISFDNADYNAAPWEASPKKGHDGSVIRRRMFDRVRYVHASVVIEDGCEYSFAHDSTFSNTDRLARLYRPYDEYLSTQRRQCNRWMSSSPSDEVIDSDLRNPRPGNSRPMDERYTATLLDTMATMYRHCKESFHVDCATCMLDAALHPYSAPKKHVHFLSHRNDSKDGGVVATGAATTWFNGRPWVPL